MKIAVVSDYFYPSLGGITEHVYNFTKYALRQGHDVKLITPTPFTYSKNKIAKHDEMFFKKDVVIRLGRALPVFSNNSLSQTGISWNMGKTLRELFKAEKFDVIHAHSPIAGFTPMLSVKYSDALTIGTFHTYFKKNFWFDTFKPTLKKYMEALDGRIAVSQSSKQLIAERLGGECTFIPNGVDTETYGNTTEKIEKFNDGKFNVFFIGRADVRNGIPFLIRSFKKAKKEYSNMRLIIAGDGPWLPNFKEMAKGEFEDDIHFVGRLNKERPVYYNTADIHVFPAEISAWSITVLEGLAAGKPVITTDMQSFREIITQGKEGFLVKYDDEKDLSGRIIELAQDKDLKMRMGANARERALVFSWDNVTKKIINFYKETYNKVNSCL